MTGANQAPPVSTRVGTAERALLGDMHGEETLSSEAALDHVRDLQAAFLMVLESSLDVSGKIVAARRLLASARASSEAAIAIPAMQWELERDLDRLTAHLDEPQAFESALEHRLLQMHRRRETACNTCLRPLPSVATIESWQRERALSALSRDWIDTRSRRSDS